MIEQDTEQWHNEKLGVVSGTRAYNLMSSAATRRTLRAQIVREFLLADSKQIKTTADMQRGKLIEPEMVSYYSIMTNQVVTDTRAYIESPLNPMFAVSPDGLVAPDGGFEGKRLDEENHIKLLDGASPEKKYVWQCKWGMFITGRKWWELFYYCETLPDAMRGIAFRYERDEDEMTLMRLTAEQLLLDITEFLDRYGLAGLLK